MQFSARFIKSVCRDLFTGNPLFIAIVFEGPLKKKEKKEKKKERKEKENRKKEEKEEKERRARGCFLCVFCVFRGGAL